jgi:formyl-CoA transferase
LNSLLVSAPADFWIARLAAAGIPCGTVRTVPDALASADVENLATVNHSVLGPIKQVLGPIRLNGAYLAPVLPPPMLDEHHGDLLKPGNKSSD